MREGVYTERHDDRLGGRVLDTQVHGRKGEIQQHSTTTCILDTQVQMKQALVHQRGVCW